MIYPHYRALRSQIFKPWRFMSSTAQVNARASRSTIKHLLVLDFEATCGNTVERPEIIEFPLLVYNFHEDTIEATFHEYVRPEVQPQLTPFCTDLTGITQDMVENADNFAAVWKRFQEFLDTHGFTDPETMNTHIFVTCGDWDFKTMLPKQLDLSAIEQGRDGAGRPIEPYDRWINLKTAFKKQMNMPRTNVGMAGMLQKLKLDLIGRHHSGIDDCHNILRIIQKLRDGGWDPSTTRPSRLQ